MGAKGKSYKKAPPTQCRNLAIYPRSGRSAMIVGLSMHDRIETKLRTALAPVLLEIIDESALHAGHAGARPGGSTHFRVRIVAKRFDGESRIARQRLVYDLLAQEFADGVHALALDAKSPADAQKATRVSP